jgi:autotransporter-associated beta strand protein
LYVSQAATAGSANTGGGGGGGGNPLTTEVALGAAGGSGIVIVRYLGSQQANGGTVTAGSGSSAGYTIHTFTTAGSDTFTLLPSLSTISGNISGTGGILKSGIATLTLSGSNTFSGNTSINAGRLLLSNTFALGQSTFTGGSGTLSFGSLTAATFGGLSGATNLALTNTSAAAVALAVGANNTNTSYSGVLSGAGGLTKVGTGVLTLAAANTLSGSTLISAGRLEIGGAGSINSTSGVTVNGAGADFKYNSATSFTQPLTLTQGILSGTGTIATAVNVGANAIIAPGNSPGIQTYASSVWSQGGTYQWELNALTGTTGTNWDAVNVTGLLNLSGLLPTSMFNLDLITLTGSNTPGLLDVGYDGGTYEFPIALYSSTSSLVVPTGFSNTAGSDLTSLFNISLAGWQGTTPNQSDISVKVNSTGTGLNLVIVPEPAAIALAGIGIAAALAFRRRRAA